MKALSADPTRSEFGEKLPQTPRGTLLHAEQRRAELDHCGAPWLSLRLEGWIQVLLRERASSDLPPRSHSKSGVKGNASSWLHQVAGVRCIGCSCKLSYKEVLKVVE